MSAGVFVLAFFTSVINPHRNKKRDLSPIVAAYAKNFKMNSIFQPVVFWGSILACGNYYK